MKLTDIYIIPSLKWLVALAVVPMIVACSNDDILQDDRRTISIVPQWGEKTRGTEPMDGSEYAVWASAIFEGSLMFKDLKMDYVNNTFVATNYYYPLSNSLYVAAFATNSSTKEKPNVTLETATTNGTSRFSKMTIDMTQADGKYEVVWTPVKAIDCPPAENPYIVFKRPTANLRFAFIPADEATCSHVTINSIKVEQIKWQYTYSATFTNQTGGYDHSITTPSGLQFKDYTISIPSTNRMKWENDKAVPMQVDNGIYIVPRDNRTRIIINYTMKNSTASVGGSLSASDDGTRNLYYVIDAEPTKNWAASTQYYYNIKVHGNAQMDVEKVAVEAIHVGATGTMEI